MLLLLKHSTMYATLEQIEEAIRKYFILDEKSHRKFAALDRNYPEKPQNPIVVFVALASINKHKKKAILDCLQITNSMYVKYVYYTVEAYNLYNESLSNDFTSITERQKLVVLRFLKCIAYLNRTHNNCCPTLNNRAISIEEIMAY